MIAAFALGCAPPAGNAAEDGPAEVKAGYRDADLADGSEISAMSYCYGHNARVGCKHLGLFFAHVPPELRDRLVAGEAGNVSILNDILEIELRRLPSKQLFGVVKRIYRPAGAWGTAASSCLRAVRRTHCPPMARRSAYGWSAMAWRRRAGLA